MAYYVATRYGHRIDLLDPDPAEIDIRDIAWALARVPRFAGHTTAPWTVAEHSCLVSRLKTPGSLSMHRLPKLLHDAGEAYMGDLPRGVKACLAEIVEHYTGKRLNPFEHIEQLLLKAVAKRYSFDYALLQQSSIVKEADERAQLLEVIHCIEPEHWKLIYADAEWAWASPPAPPAFDSEHFLAVHAATRGCHDVRHDAEERIRTVFLTTFAECV